MRTVLVYPLPFNVWDTYEPFVRRFVLSLKEHPAEADFELWVTCHWGEPTDALHQFFYGTKAKFVPYYRDGCQIGAQQEVAATLENCFVIGLTGHTYFHRAGWLRRFMDIRETGGAGLYGTCGSLEGRPHLRTNFYGMDAELWHEYPFGITTREHCSRFECGDLSLSDWYTSKTGLHPTVVHWDSVNVIEDRVPNGYRDGNQEQLLVWDRHTDMYAEGTDEDKVRLSNLAKGIASEPAKE